MKKKGLWLFLLAILSIFGFSINGNAATAPSTITIAPAKTINTYISGLEMTRKTTTGGYDAFCLQDKKTYPANLTLKYNGVANDGFVYILSHKPNTGDSNKDYYIMQVAAWWYQDILTASNANLSNDFKVKMGNERGSNQIYNYIYNLVQNAKSYSQTKGTLNVVGNNNFTLEGDSYISGVITVKGTNLTGLTIDLVGAPSGAKIIDKNISNSTYSGTFKISVPESSISAGQTVNFSIKVTGSYKTYAAYEYYYGSGYQLMLFGYLYSDTVNLTDGVNLKITKEDTPIPTPTPEHNYVKINKIDQDKNGLAGATLALYSGNCLTTTCSESNLYAKWVSNGNYKVFTDVPVGSYTLVEVSAPSGYGKTANQLIPVNATTGTFSYTMMDVKEYEVPDHNVLSITKVDENNEGLSGARLALYKGNCTATTCKEDNLYKEWTSTSSAKTFEDVPVGTYTLVEVSAPKGYKTATNMLVYVNAKNGTFTYSMTDYKNSKVRISKTDITGEKEIPGATLVLKDEKNKVVDTWVSTNEPHYVTLDEGIYSLNETIAPKGYKLSSTTIVFKVDKNGKIYQKNYNGSYTLVDYIKMVNDVNDVVNIAKLDSKTNAYLSGAILMIKNLKGETIATWTTTNESHYLSLDAGEYILSEEAAPDGYVLNTNAIYFKVNSDGTVMVKNNNGVYETATNVVMYNTPETPEIVLVPKTGLSSAITYITGTLVLIAGAFVLVKYGKKC